MGEMDGALTEGYRGRLAPTTSGLLHLGHARTFAAAQQRAKEFGGKLVLRIEDIDSQRCKPEYAQAALSDLKACGFKWDEGPDIGGPFGPYIQSMRTELYKKALIRLIEKNAVYPSSASRKQISQASKIPEKKLFPDAEPEHIFPKALRECDEGFIADAKKHPFCFNWRFRVEDGKSVAFQDGAFGNIRLQGQRDFGDFLVWRKSGEPAYELAVCVDDASMEISEVVRGADLIVSTVRQLLVYESLGLKHPDFFHCPLMRDKSGKKISKSSLVGSDKNPLLIRNSLSAARKLLA